MKMVQNLDDNQYQHFIKHSRIYNIKLPYLLTADFTAAINKISQISAGIVSSAAYTNINGCNYFYRGEKWKRK